MLYYKILVSLINFDDHVIYAAFSSGSEDHKKCLHCVSQAITLLE